MAQHPVEMILMRQLADYLSVPVVLSTMGDTQPNIIADKGQGLIEIPAACRAVSSTHAAAEPWSRRWAISSPPRRVGS